MIRETAFALHRRGWCVLPLHPRTKDPALRTWKRFQTARPTEVLIDEWFRSKTKRGLAVVLGAVSGGLTCRDFDRMDAFEAWAAAYPELAATLPQSQTSRGRHVYFIATPGAVEQISRTGKSIVDWDDGELRGGGLAVLPPSVHESGHVYRWIIPPGDIVPRLEDLAAAGFDRSWIANGCAQLPATAQLRSDEYEPECSGKSDLNPKFPIHGDDSESRLKVQRASDTSRPAENRTAVRIPDAESADFTESTEEDGRVPKRTEENGCHEGECVVVAPPSPLTADLSAIASHIEKAIAATLPTGPSRRNNALFQLARHLKGIPELHDADPRHLRSVVLEWHQRALAVIETKSPEQTLAEFYRGWKGVKFPVGGEPLRKSFAEALAEPFPRCCDQYPTLQVKQLIALCRRLQQGLHPEAFFLSCRSAGKLLGVSHVTANAWLYLLCEDGVLKLKSAGTPGTRKASRYWYVAD